MNELSEDELNALIIRLETIQSEMNGETDSLRNCLHYRKVIDELPVIMRVLRQEAFWHSLESNGLDDLPADYCENFTYSEEDE